MTVYVAYYSDCDGFFILGIYSTLEKAQQSIKNFSSKDENLTRHCGFCTYNIDED